MFFLSDGVLLKKTLQIFFLLFFYPPLFFVKACFYPAGFSVDAVVPFDSRKNKNRNPASSWTDGRMDGRTVIIIWLRLQEG